MNGKTFLDTNILVYAYSSGDPREQRAEELVLAGGTISVQVLTEFVNVSTRKQGRSWPEIQRVLLTVRALLDPPVPLTATTHEYAVSAARRFNLHIYDAMIVAAAVDAGCTTLYTEDMQHGQVIDGLTIRNPFRT